MQMKHTRLRSKTVGNLFGFESMSLQMRSGSILVEEDSVTKNKSQKKKSPAFWVGLTTGLVAHFKLAGAFSLEDSC